MTLKRTLCAAAALAVTATALAVPASAATAKTLLTEPVKTVSENEAIWSMGNPLYGRTGDDGYLNSFYSITESDIKSWRETGEFSYNEVEVSGNIDYDMLSPANNMICKVSDGSIKKAYAYDFNGKDALSVKYVVDGWANATDDGYTVQFSSAPDKLTMYVTDPSGNVSSSSLDIAVHPFDETCAYFWRMQPLRDNSDYVCAVLYADKVEFLCEDEYYGNVFDVSLNLALVKKDGTTEKVWNDTIQKFTGILGAGDDYVVFATSKNLVVGLTAYAYNMSTGKVIDTSWYEGYVKLTNSDGSEAEYDGKAYTLNSVSSIQGDKAIAHYTWSYNGESADGYALIELTDGAYAPISGYYAGMYTMDGEMYLVKTADGKWGYINSNGELLKTFDDAGEFNGKYAPVINDGKAYLINRNMKRVSEKIDAEGVGTLDNGLYTVTIDGEKYFMTYADADDTAAEEPADETPADDSNAPEDNTPDTAAPDTDNTVSDSETTPAATGDKTNPDTGAGSVAVIAAAAITAAGIIAVSRKQKR